ncbi:hypothetical protein OP10G_4707 [Fimbriimonas ginsengisoli Gsoil 348]|uniref:CHAT domain-containing protein n=1 Tax=Fimbriimonas ginsengisoli Gsoil 348 TaxID=661478 RepID=A0A068NYF4_FIMGI|nr:hypothetical protein OP10G_4707 [Fimbriimonas ginsengisoli Gsoil 348]
MFRQLKAGKPCDLSLQRAALNVMRTRGKEHPYYWAGFRLIGDSQPVHF